MATPVTVRLKRYGGTWEVAGRDSFPDVYPESLQASANEWGPDTCSFSLTRSRGAFSPDLSAFTPCEIEINGRVVWQGRVREAPTRSSGRSLAVQGQGWQYHLDDDVFERLYLAARADAWRDQRSFLGADLTKFMAAGQVEVGDGIISMGFAGSTIWPTSGRMGVTLDAGPDSVIKRVYVLYDWSNSSGSSVAVNLEGGDVDNEVVAVEGPAAATLASGGSGTNAVLVGTFTTARRYVHVFVNQNTSFTSTGEFSLKVRGIYAARDTAYMDTSGNSLLTADMLVKDALTFAPLLSQDQSLIAGVSFHPPEFNLDGMRTPRELIQAANAFHRYRTRIVTGPKLEFAPQPSAPLWQLTSSDSFEDQSANSGDEVYNRCIAEGTGPDGATTRVKRTSSDIAASTVIDKQGFTRTKVLPIQSGLTTALGQQLADVFLNAHRSTPLKGAFAAQPGAVTKVATGEDVHPADLLNNTTELVRFADQIDPDTGGLGRDGVIAAVVYNHADESAQVTIDNQRDNFEAVLNRLAVVTG